ncbi:MAG: ATP-binding protein [bacterium]
MNLYKISLVSVVLFNLFLGIFVLTKNVNARINRIFCIYSGFLSIWGFGMLALSLVPESKEEIALWCVPILHFGLVFLPPIFFHFVLSLTKNEAKFNRCLSQIGYLMSTLFFIIDRIGSFSISSGVTFIFGSYRIVGGPLSPFFNLFFLLLVSFGIYLLFASYKIVSSPLEKNYYKYLFFGMSVVLLSAISNILRVMGFRVYPLAHIGILFFNIMTAYSIVKYKLMDIDLVIRPGIAYGTLTGLITATWLCSIFVFERFLFVSSFISRLLSMFIVIFVFNVLKERVQTIVDRLFYRERLELSKATARIANQITSSVDPDLIIASSIDELHNSIHSRFIVLMLLNNEETFYEIKYIFGEVDKKAFSPFITLNNPFVEWLKKQRGWVLRDEIDGRREAIKVNYEMEKNNIRFVTPLFIQDKIIGLLLLGEKKVGYYTFPEISLLETTANELAIALENTRLYSELKEKKEELEKANQAKTDFLHIVSHELNTPLSVIMGQTYLLEKGLKKKTDISSMVDVIKKRGEHLAALIKDIMDVSSLEKGEKYEPKRDTIDIERLISNTVKSFKLMAFNKGLEIEIDVASDVSFTSDKSVLENILFRLLDNAIKFTPSGGEILVGAEKREGEVLFFVKDTGIGIADEYKEKIFERFSQIDQSSTRKYGGLGLGLSIVKDMVQALKGKIWVEGELNKGSKFCFTLPL